MRRTVLAWLLAAAACGGHSTPQPQVSEPLVQPTRPVAPDAARAQASCDEGGIFRVGERDYCMTREALSWQEADRRCLALGGALAHFASKPQWQALQEQAVSPVEQHTLWVGLRRPQDEWLWSSTKQPLDYDIWAEGEPNNAGAKERCGEWISRTGRLNDVGCEHQRASLCESTDADIPCRGLELAGAGTRYCVSPQPLLTWDEASTACEQRGWSLATLDTAQEQAFLRRTLAARLTMARLWLGLTDQAQEGRWRWSSGAPVQMTQWGSGQPDNANGEHCGEWRLDHNDWNDILCDRPRRGLCLLSPSESAVVAR